jgi:solute carrier family 25 aspartate/glutamate transporter 12/13
MAALSEQVGEVLLGTTDEPQLSQLTRAAFMKNAQKDEATGEFYLDEDHFIEAVAPESEDYVSNCACHASTLAHSHTGRS